MEHPMMAQAMAQTPFFYYNPENKADARQHRGNHFSHQPHMNVYGFVPTVPSMPIYSRPASAASPRPASQAPTPTLFSNGPATMTPAASPVPAVAQKPCIVLETEIKCESSDYYPSTPPLSTSGSAISSPGSCDMLQTPMNPMFSGLDGFEGVAMKADFEPVEPLPVEWTSCASPPMTPVYLQSQPGQAASLNANGDILSASACPSLSPSPSPYARSVASEDDVSFCDPRNLTVGIGAVPANGTTTSPEFAAIAAAEPELRSPGAVSPPCSAQQHAFAFEHSIPDGLPHFEELSDLESEADFANLVNLGEHHAPVTAAEARRPRACTGSSIVSLGHASFIGEDDLSFEETEPFPDFEYIPSPPYSATPSSDDDCHDAKRQKKSNGSKMPKVNVAASGSTPSGSNSTQDSANASNQSGAAGDSAKSSPSPDSPSGALPAPANRRGRKQSLTEDPSKTFVCDLCNRRFRRQEHLKRHYRSLHTQEKPFECNECGKKFSRSDNLAQHARTHGSGAIVMDLIDDANMHHGMHPGMAMPMGYPHPHMMPHDAFHDFSKVLFQVAADMPGSASELSSEDGMSDLGKKKRKRVD